MTNKDEFIVGITDKYNEELLKNRISVEGNVCASILKDLLLIDDSNLKPTDFITNSGRFIYGLANDLRQKGFSILDEVTVLSNSKEEVIEKLENVGGYDAIQRMIDSVNEKNYEAYLDKLLRENILLKMKDDGFNLTEPIDYNGKKVIPLKLMRKMTAEEVQEFWELRINMYGSGYSSKILEEGEIEFSDEFIASCLEGLESGVPFDIAGEAIDGTEISCFPAISRQIDGLMEGTSTGVCGASSTGKSTIVATMLLGLLYRGRNITVISNEQRKSVLTIQMLCLILAKYCKYFKLSKQKLKSGDITEEDKKQIKIAQKYWKDNFSGRLNFVAIPDADMGLVKKKSREYILRYGSDTIFYDTMKADLTNNDMNNSYESLIRDSRELDKIAKKYNIIMIYSIQAAMATVGTLFLDGTILSGCKAIKEILENLLLMRVVYDEELDPSNKKYYCRPFKRKLVNGKWMEEEYIPDRTCNYRMLFPDKVRNGESSNETGTAHLLKFYGKNGVFIESALCRPRRTRIGV